MNGFWFSQPCSWPAAPLPLVLSKLSPPKHCLLLGSGFSSALPNAAFPVQFHQKEKVISYLSSHFIFIVHLWQIINPILEMKPFQCINIRDLTKNAPQIGDMTSLKHTHTNILFTPLALQVWAKAALPQGWMAVWTQGWGGELQESLYDLKRTRGERGKKKDWSRVGHPLQGMAWPSYHTDATPHHLTGKGSHLKSGHQPAWRQLWGEGSQESQETRFYFKAAHSPFI